MGTVAQHYRDLIAWQKSIELIQLVYVVTSSFPTKERFGLTNQVRRATVSIASNIAEGQGRGTSADFVRFLWMANGSLQEAETQIILSNRLEYVGGTETTKLLQLTAEIGRILYGLIRSLSDH